MSGQKGEGSAGPPPTSSKSGMFSRIRSKFTSNKDDQTNHSATQTPSKPPTATSLRALSETGPINKALEPPSKSSSQVAQKLSPISELWNEAYKDLRDKDEKLMRNYEATAGLSGSDIGEDQMKSILEAKVQDVNKNTWKLEFGGRGVLVKDLMKPVVAIVDWSNEYISAAVSANPYASVAWAGVSLLLLVSNSFPKRLLRQ
jgi:hypothetical protein